MLFSHTSLPHIEVFYFLLLLYVCYTTSRLLLVACTSSRFRPLFWSSSLPHAVVCSLSVEDIYPTLLPFQSSCVLPRMMFFIFCPLPASTMLCRVFLLLWQTCHPHMIQLAVACYCSHFAGSHVVPHLCHCLCQPIPWVFYSLLYTYARCRGLLV